MLRVGLLGVGHFGKYHLLALQEIQDIELIGFYDIDKEKAQAVSKQFNVKSFDSYDELLELVDVIDIVVPTVSHYECAVKAIKKQKHVFIEKPVTSTLEEAESLLKLAEEADVKVQVGHIERFNAAFLAAKSMIVNPMFIEIHRLQEFTVRSTDVSVVLNLMIHDIDIVLSTVKSNIKRISASGVNVVTETPDIANARLEFDNGCVANITASRVSLRNMRRARFFQKDSYITVDFLNINSDVIKIEESGKLDTKYAFLLDSKNGKPPKGIVIDNPVVTSNNALKEELNSFASSIINDTNPVVTLEEGYQSLSVANIILQKMIQSPSLHV